MDPLSCYEINYNSEPVSSPWVPLVAQDKEVCVIIGQNFVQVAWMEYIKQHRTVYQTLLTGHEKFDQMHVLLRELQVETKMIC
jgi:hypothetical protein